MKTIGYETMFVITEDGEGKWEKYDDTYDITIHCRSKEEKERAMEIINAAAKLIKGKVKTNEALS